MVFPDGKAETDGHLCTKEPYIYLDQSKPDAVLELLKNTSHQSGFLQDRKGIVCYGLNSQQPEHVQGAEATPCYGLPTYPASLLRTGWEWGERTANTKKARLPWHDTDRDRKLREARELSLQASSPEKSVLSVHPLVSFGIHQWWA